MACLSSSHSPSARTWTLSVQFLTFRFGFGPCHDMRRSGLALGKRGLLQSLPVAPSCQEGASPHGMTAPRRPRPRAPNARVRVMSWSRPDFRLPPPSYRRSQLNWDGRARTMQLRYSPIESRNGHIPASHGVSGPSTTETYFFIISSRRMSNLLFSAQDYRFRSY